MYKVASDRHQAALHRGRPSDWVNGRETLSLDDQIKQLQEGTKILNNRICALPARSDERRRLGQEKAALQAELHELRSQKKRTDPLEWKSFFVNEAKRILSDSQFEMIHRAAIRECKLCAERTGRPVSPAEGE